MAVWMSHVEIRCPNECSDDLNILKMYKLSFGRLNLILDLQFDVLVSQVELRRPFGCLDVSRKV